VGVSWVAWYLPDSRAILGEGCQLLLYPVHPVDAVDEQNQNEDERDLEYVREDNINEDEVFSTFRPYWSFAIIGLSEMKANSLRLTVKGRGMMRARKTAISNTRRRKT
jgi:hypothetical protein